MPNIVMSLADRLRAGPTAHCAWVSLSEPLVSEDLAREAFDAIILDVQHGIHTVGSVIAAIGGALVGGKPTLVRVGVEEFSDSSRYLDNGAAGIIAPMINSVADARRFAGFMKFPPLGSRSWGPDRAIGLTKLAPQEYLTRANGFSLAIAMIETREALDIVDDILAVPGIDGIFVGPSDLSIGLTGGATVDSFHPEVDKALTHVATRARAHGKLAGAFCMTGERAGRLGARGFHFLSISTDRLMLRAAARAELAAVAGTAAAGTKPASY